jgi:hypothetical protein
MRVNSKENIPVLTNWPFAGSDFIQNPTYISYHACCRNFMTPPKFSDPPSALRPSPGQVVRSVSPNTTQNNFNSKPRQFNTPQGLYSEESTNSSYKLARCVYTTTTSTIYKPLGTCTVIACSCFQAFTFFLVCMIWDIHQ